MISLDFSPLVWVLHATFCLSVIVKLRAMGRHPAVIRTENWNYPALPDRPLTQPVQWIQIGTSAAQPSYVTQLSRYRLHFIFFQPLREINPESRTRTSSLPGKRQRRPRLAAEQAAVYEMRKALATGSFNVIPCDCKCKTPCLMLATRCWKYSFYFLSVEMI